MSLNPRNQPQTVETITTNVNLNSTGIVAIAGPLRFPRQVTARFHNNAAGGIVGGMTLAGSYAAAGALSGNPTSVQVVLVSGAAADIQFLAAASGVAESGLRSDQTPAVSGLGYSGISLVVTWRGD